MEFLVNSTSNTYVNRTWADPLPLIYVTPEFRTAHSVICFLQGTVLLLSSGIPLVFFVKDCDLRSGFNCYLINMLVANLVYVVYLFIMAWDTHFDAGVTRGLCTFFMPLLYVAGIPCMGMQTLVSVNRIWALYFPDHYRRKHTKKTAIRLCAVIWIFTFGLTIPYTVLTYILLGRSKFPRKCIGLRGVILPSFIIPIIMFLYLPIIVILVLYPFSLRKFIAHQKVHAEVQSRNRMQVTSFVMSQNDNSETAVKPNSVPDGVQRPRARVKPIRSIKFLVLTWVVICTAIFWLPLLFHSAVMQVRRYKTYDYMGSAWLVAWMLVDNCVEPWIFVFTIPMLKQKFRRLFLAH